MRQVIAPFLLHHLLEQSAARAPGSTVLVCQDRTLAYRELDDLSNRLANTLRRHGVEKGDRVGIGLEKSVESIVAIFGILKAGAAYVPIDPRAPATRAAYIIDNCQMQGLVTTQARLAALQPALASTPSCVVLADQNVRSGCVPWKEVLDAPPILPADPELVEGDLAYILYTSGSTGEPKGVMISHRAALAFVNWAVDYLQLQPGDRFSNHAPLHFDLSIFDIFGAVSVGATVAIVPPSVSVFPRNLADWIERAGITVWYSVPSVLTQLALHGGLERHRYDRLRLILFAGEVFPAQHLRRLMTLVPRAAYFNWYGPTETNVCTAYAVTGIPPEHAPPLPIGRACANTEVFAVNEQGRLAGTGETGELLVSGPTLMLGYWGRPEQTQAVLAPNPLQPDRLERAYRTGDIVRRDESGDYHFIGRRDAQVKSRGYRIELGDIEAVLHRHPSVVEAVVVSQPHDEFGCILRAVVSARENSRLDRGELAAFCAGQLPPYMIPTDFEFRAALPKTSSGKVDRKALQSGA